MSDEPRVLAGRYRLLSVLGRGGMGQVWLAEDELLGRRVAVKEIRFPSGLPTDERDVLRERTLREARLTARLSHPGIITVYDVVSDDGSPYIVMELVTAPSLAAAVDMEGSLPPERVAQIGLRLLDALDVAHAAGIMHRDVKPSNVLLDGDRVVLSDFGIATSSSDATLTSTGMVVGSPTYMSPERLRSEGVGPAGDLWSLGATLYAALEGHPPFRAQNVMGTITAVLVDPPAPPSVPGPLRDAVLGLLEKSPDRRLTSAQVRSLLEQAVAEPAPRPAGPHPSADLPVMAPAVESPVEPAVGPAVEPQSAGPDQRTVERTVTAPEPDPVPEPVQQSSARWHDAPAARPLPEAPKRPPPAPSQPGPRSRPGRRSLAAGVLVLAVVVAAVAAYQVLRPDGTTPSAGSDSDGRGAGTSQGSGAGAEPTETEPTETEPTETEPSETEPTDPTGAGGPEVPAGYRLVRDPLDFTVAVPRGWERRLDGATRVDFVSPDGSQFLRVDQVAEAGADAEQAWLSSEESLSQSLSGYERLRIEPVEYRGWEAADWEFTWAGESGTVHVLNRGIITDPRGFALYMSGPDESWEAESLPVFEVAAETFRPSA